MPEVTDQCEFNKPEPVDPFTRNVVPGDPGALSWDELRTVHHILRRIAARRPHATRISLFAGIDDADTSPSPYLSLICVEHPPGGERETWVDRHPIPVDYRPRPLPSPPSDHQPEPTPDA